MSDEETNLVLELTDSTPTLVSKGGIADLENMQVRALRYLYHNKGQYLTVEQIHNYVWNEETDNEMMKNRVKI